MPKVPLPGRPGPLDWQKTKRRRGFSRSRRSPTRDRAQRYDPVARHPIIRDNLPKIPPTAGGIYFFVDDFAGRSFDFSATSHGGDSSTSFLWTGQCGAWAFGR